MNWRVTFLENGLTRTPSRSELLNQWARSGLPQTLPMRHPSFIGGRRSKQLGPQTISAEELLGTQTAGMGALQ